MGHNVEAIIVSAEADLSSIPSAKIAKRIPLPCGLMLIPITDEFFDEVATTASNGSEGAFEEFWKFPKGLLPLVESLSKDQSVAYVETEYFGGTGVQAAAVWLKGKLVYGPKQNKKIGPINAALRRLGVRASDGRDEFDTIGLGRFRSNEDWIEQPQFGKALE